MNDPMAGKGVILLLGGTSDTAAIATALATIGAAVLVSTATEAALDVGDHPAIERRCGRLDLAAMVDLCRSRRVRLVVDATHPYAAEVRATAQRAAEQLLLPYLTFVRPPAIAEGEADALFAADHEQAATLAFSFGRAVLLTTGSRNLAPYVSAAAVRQTPLYVRVLDEPESLAACREAGIAEANIIAARGPFSIEENRQHIRRFHAGVVVTKDSGLAGGVLEKLQAARLEGCRLVVVRRPAPAAGRFDRLDALAAAAAEHLRHGHFSDP